MSFGQTLRTAREAKGLTASKLASRTHLLVQIIEGLENEDFHRIPAPIYGRGFIKLYCEVVGLDPKPLQAEFMSLYTLSKEAPAKTVRPAPPSQKEIPPAPSAVVPSPPPPPQQAFAPQEEPDPEPPPAVEEVAPAAVPPPVIADVVPEPERQPVVETNPEPEPPSVVETNLEPEPQTVVGEMTAKPEPLPIVEEGVPETVPPPRRSYGELFEHTYAQEEPEKPSAAEKFRDTMSNVSHGVFANVKKLPPNTGRIVMVCIAAIFLLVLIGWGIAALYKATSPQPSGEKTQEIKDVSQPKQGTATKPLPKTDNVTAPTKSLPKTTETTSSKAPPTPPKRDATSTKAVSLPTKRSAASGEGKAAAKAKTGTLKSSGIQIPSLYID